MEENKQKSLDKLRLGITLLLEKYKSEEPEYLAIEHYSERTGNWSRMSEYAIDLGRIEKELSLCVTLIKGVPSEDFLLSRNTTVEDYLMYHQGYFLELVHQFKDKLFRLVDAIISQEGLTQAREGSDIKVAVLVEKVESMEITALPALLRVWDQESESGIGVALKRRTQYHHFRNKLLLDPDFLNIQLTRTFETEAFHSMLSEKGKKKMAERGKESTEKWHTNLIRRVEETEKVIHENAKQISEILVEHFQFPVSEGEATEIFTQTELVRKSLEVENTTTEDKISEEFLPIVKQMREGLAGAQQGIVSFYLTGSVPRGDAVYGISDINLVLVLDKNHKDALTQEIQKLMALVESTDKIDIQIFSKEEFLSDAHQKTRYICKTDGLLLQGEDLVSQEDFPKPGIVLAFLLNHDFKEKVRSARETSETTNEIDQEKVNQVAYSISKAMLRMIFAETMSNKALYVKTLDEMRSIAEEQHPNSKYVLDILYSVAKGEGIIDKNGLSHLLDFAEENLLPLLEKIETTNTDLKQTKKYR